MKKYTLKTAIINKLKQGNPWNRIGIKVYANSCWKRKDDKGRRYHRFHCNKQCCISSVSRNRGSGLSKNPEKSFVALWLNRAISNDLDICAKCCDVTIPEINKLIETTEVNP